MGIYLLIIKRLWFNAVIILLTHLPKKIRAAEVSPAAFIINIVDECPSKALRELS